MEIENKKKIVKNIEALKSKAKYLKLFRFLVDKKIVYTQNRNGVFVDMNSLSQDNLKEMDQFVFELIKS